MTSAEPLDLIFAIPFDHPVYVDVEVLGSARDIPHGPTGARLELPRHYVPESRSIALMPPVSAGQIGSHLEDGWGLQEERQPRAQLHAFLVVVPVWAEIEFDLPKSQISGEGVDATLDAVSEWSDSFVHWLWVITAQALDAINPDPKVLHRRSDNIIVAASSGRQRSIPTIDRPSRAIRLDIANPTCERIIDLRVLDLATGRAGSDRPPLMWEFLASARMAGRRSDSRRALIDAGTAAEAALSIMMALPSDHRLTLGSLVMEAVRREIPIADDAQEALVRPRNDAVHRGTASRETVFRALEIAEDLVAQADPDFIRTSTLKDTNRPQRSEIVFIRPPITPGESHQ